MPEAQLKLLDSRDRRASSDRMSSFSRDLVLFHQGFGASPAACWIGSLGWLLPCTQQTGLETPDGVHRAEGRGE
jgi:hypothetical protein